MSEPPAHEQAELTPPAAIRRADPSERREVVEAFLRLGTETARSADDLLAMHDRGELPLNGLLIAETDAAANASIVSVDGSANDAIVGVCLYSLGRDGTAILWAPRADGRFGLPLGRGLLQAAVEAATDDGATLVQMTLPHDHPHRELLAGCLHFYTALLFLTQSRPFKQTADAAAVVATPYRDAERDLFVDLLRETFRDSQDCPEMRAVQSAERSLASIEATGTSGTTHWLRFAAAANPEESIGLVLLTEQPTLNAWELAYLGLRPPHRRAGLAASMLTHALQEAVAADTLLLAVDMRNAPALKLYRRAGFVAFDRQEVWLDRSLRQP